MKKKNLPLLENIHITGIAAEGKAIARVDDIVLFVSCCVPGDIVDVQITKKKHHYMEGRVVRLVKPSNTRCEAKCQHYGLCGGCKWQILPYDEQLRWKQQQVEDNLKRIGHLELPNISPIIGSTKIYEYRNKLEFTFADRQWLTTEEMKAEVPFHPAIGFHIPNSFDKVLDIETCYLMDNINNLIRNHIRTYAIEHGLTFYNEHSHTGQLRNLVIRTNEAGDVMVVVVFGEAIQENMLHLLESLKETFERIVSLQYVVNEKMNDTIGDLNVIVYYGSDHIVEKMEDLQFKVGPKSFYQTNTEQAYELYKVAKMAARLTGNEIVYDLYTGTGTIAQFIARQAKQVIGIEYVPEAIEDAKANAQANHLTNTTFIAGDMKDILTTDFVKCHGRPDVIITDPPRAGMHEDVIDVIRQTAPKRIVYVSCNPATQARDLELLSTDYSIEMVQPVDMFPHTQHVENVVLLVQK